nr:MAG TPA: hypothetical protein [Caudoviricetes sp.]
MFYDRSKLNITSVSDTRTGRGYRYKNRSQGRLYRQSLTLHGDRCSRKQ